MTQRKGVVIGSADCPECGGHVHSMDAWGHVQKEHDADYELWQRLVRAAGWK